MRRQLHVLALALVAGAAASAQNTKPTERPPAKPIPADALEKHLKSWEAEMHKVTSLHAELNRIDKDKTFGTTTRLTGKALYQKAGTGPTAMNLGYLELTPVGKAEFSEKIVCTGTYLYQFAPAQKEIRAYEVPRGKDGKMGEDSFQSLLFGMKAAEAKKRYVLTAKEDPWYVYLDVAPRNASDKADFEAAQLVLNKKDYMPAQLWFKHVNGSEVTWQIAKLKTGVQLDRRVFDRPTAPAGWKVVPIHTKTASAPPAGVPPRVARPKDGQ